MATLQPLAETNRVWGTRRATLHGTAQRCSRASQSCLLQPPHCQLRLRLMSNLISSGELQFRFCLCSCRLTVCLTRCCHNWSLRCLGFVSCIMELYECTEGTLMVIAELVINVKGPSRKDSLQAFRHRAHFCNPVPASNFNATCCWFEFFKCKI